MHFLKLTGNSLSYFNLLVFIVFFFSVGFYRFSCYALSVTEDIRPQKKWIFISETPKGINVVSDLTGHQKTNLEQYISAKSTLVKRSKRRGKDPYKKQSKSKGKKKNLEEHELIVGMRSYGNNQGKATVKTKVDRTCPNWPKDHRLVVNCSDGQKLQSVCVVKCAPGYRLPDGAPTKRKCRSKIKRRGKNATKFSQPTWSGRDDQFTCGELVFVMFRLLGQTINVVFGVTHNGKLLLRRPITRFYSLLKAHSTLGQPC